MENLKADGKKVAIGVNVSCNRKHSLEFLAKVGVSGQGKKNCFLGGVRNISCDVLASMVEIAAGCGQVSFGRVKPYNFAFSGKNLTFAVFGGSITEGRRHWTSIAHDVA